LSREGGGAGSCKRSGRESQKSWEPGPDSHTRGAATGGGETKPTEGKGKWVVSIDSRGKCGQ